MAPLNRSLVVADAMVHILEATTLHEGNPPCRITLPLKLVTLTVGDCLALPLAKLPQRLEV